MCNWGCKYERIDYGLPDTRCVKPKWETCPMEFEEEEHATTMDGHNQDPGHSHEDFGQLQPRHAGYPRKYADCIKRAQSEAVAGHRQLFQAENEVRP